MYQAAGDSESLYFSGRTRTINSIVLLSNGISFAIQIVVFLILGAFADFGTWRPTILIGLSIVAYAIGFAWLGVHTPGKTSGSSIRGKASNCGIDKWLTGLGLYVVGLIAYQTTLTFWVRTGIADGFFMSTNSQRLPLFRVWLAIRENSGSRLNCTAKAKSLEQNTIMPT